MIIRIQMAMFFAIGFIAWDGVADTIAASRIDGQAAVMTVMTLEQLTQIRMSDL